MFRSASRFPRFLLAAASSPNAPSNPYDVLGITPTSTEKEIKKAHRNLVKKFHPDNRETGNEEKFRQVQTAFERLEESGWKVNVDNRPHGSEAPAGADPNDPGSYGKHWNPPGSTQENYVQNNGRLQAVVRAVVMWCMFFAMARYTLSLAFPDLKGRKAAQDLMMKQLEEHENARREAMEKKNNSATSNKTQNGEVQVNEKSIHDFFGSLQKTQQQQENVAIGGMPTRQIVGNDKDNSNNNDEFVAWGDLGKAKQNPNDTSNHNNNNNSWPKPDYDPLSRR